MTGAACRAGNAYPSGATDFTSGFYRGLCCLVICVSLFLVIVLSFLILSFDCSSCLITWYLYILYLQSGSELIYYIHMSFYYKICNKKLLYSRHSRLKIIIINKRPKGSVSLNFIGLCRFFFLF